MKRNEIVIIMSIALLASCVPDKKDALKLGTSRSTSAGGAGANALTVDTGLSVKTFNQYNMTLSKVTNVDATEAAITAEYEAIKNSLPADQDVMSFTSFHQISMTRLSFAYCSFFVDNDTAFKALNYTTSTADALTTQLMTRFIGAKTAANTARYDKFNATLLKIMKNDAGNDENGDPIGKLITGATGDTLNKNLTKLGCTALLSSAEFTMI